MNDSDYNRQPLCSKKTALLTNFRSLNALHVRNYVHADLKPANLMWSSYDGKFKILDFGLTFHTDEQDLHQIQSAGNKT